MKKLTIEEMRSIAEERGGKCLSDTYVNANTSLLWECVEGHQWEAKPNSIKTGTWCPHCAGIVKRTIEEMREIAEERGGKCLSDTYVNSQTQLMWECAEGHQWKAKPNYIKTGSWCPRCAGKAKGTIEEMRSIAEERGGKCLSSTYVNAHRKLLWECAEGHQWEAKPNSVKTGAWCPHCAQNKGMIEEMQKIAEEREGKCLSDTYVNKRTKLMWKCSQGHQWEATPNSIKRGSWCQTCARELTKGTIEEMQKIAEERGGKCLSDTYVNSQTQLMWECAEGHQWEAIPAGIKIGRWCQACSSGLGERICKEYLEQIFGKKFPKSYPRWLVNKRGNQMELDGYCKSLALAFEHHGEQHYSTKGKFNKSEKGLRRRQEDDRLKRELCKQHKIILIEIPEIPNRISLEVVKAFIKKECERNNVPLPSNFDTKEISLKKAYSTSVSKETLKEIQRTAVERGGKCLSDSYVHDSVILLLQCAEGHQWEATPNRIKRGTWCQVCAGLAKGTIEEMQRIAVERNGKCLSDTYVNSKMKLLWECAEGHQWEAKPNSIKTGTWCPHCAQNKGTIEELQKIAKERGGKCLSDTYVNKQTKLMWKCSQGHQWEAIPNNVKRGSWCQVCAGNVKGTIEEMQKIAEERGGKCLSDTYVNAHTSLLWECTKGHQWEARPNNIKSGTWCPYCARMARKGEKSNRILSV
jgi:predicted lactoylglutathione lyase